MNFFRLLIVVIAVTACGGLFGALVGAFMGWAAPDTLLGATFGLWTPDQHPPSPAPVDGAAAGTVYGLVAGATIAIAVGMLDQILIVVRDWLRQRRSSS